MTLRERLIHDMSWPAAEAPSFGELYDHNLRTMYARQGEDSEALEIIQDTLPINPKLVDALVKSRAATPNRSDLVEFLQTTRLANQTEARWLLSHGYEIKPWQSGCIDEALLEMVKHIALHTLDISYPAEIRAFASQIDRCLTHIYASMRTKGLDDDCFGATYRPGIFIDFYKTNIGFCKTSMSCVRLLVLVWFTLGVVVGAEDDCSIYKCV
jgi:hypothetical protein